MRSDESEFPPSGCRWDGIHQRGHARLWSPERHEAEGNGSHGWEPPTDEQIKARMLERRADKTKASTP